MSDRMKLLPVLFTTTLLSSALCHAALFTLDAKFTINSSEIAAPYAGTATFSYLNSGAFGDGSYLLSDFVDYDISITVSGASFTKGDLIPDSNTTIEIRGNSFFFARLGTSTAGSANFLNADQQYLSTEPVTAGDLAILSARYLMVPVDSEGNFTESPVFGYYGAAVDGIPEVSATLLSAVACGFGALRRRR